MASAFSIGFFEDIILSKLGVPGVGDITRKAIDAMPINDGARDVGNQGVLAVKIIENTPNYLLAIGAIIVIVGLII